MATNATDNRMKYRYLEVTYYLPDDEMCHFYAVVTVADTPTRALEFAIEDCQRAHPDAKRIEEFMQRIISEEKSVKIKRKMKDGTWEGWQFSREVD